MKQNFKRILIVQREGIGNMIMLTPTLWAIKELYPECQLTISGKYPSLEVIKDWFVVDKVVDKTNLYYEYFDFIGLTMWSGFPENNLNHNHVFECEYKLGMHEAECHFQIAHYLGYEKSMPKTYCQTKETEYSRQIIQERDQGNKTIALCDTAQRGWDCKRWPYFDKMSHWLSSHKIRHVAIGDINDKLWESGSMCLDLRGKLSLQESAGVLKSCDIVISNDSWPAHAASALGVKTYVIFMPTRIDKNKPIGKDVHVITKRKSCSPCQFMQRMQSCDCIKEIKLENVISIIQNIEK